MKSVLFTFENDEARDRFLKTALDAAISMISSSKNQDGFEARKSSGELVLSTLDTAQFDPPIKADHERQSSLWVSGQKLIEGNLSDMQKRFGQECNAHSASVVLKEYRGGVWHEIRTRRQQSK